VAYKYKTKPFGHQHDEFTQHGLDPARGVFWEQGVGKSKPMIDTTSYLYEEKEVDGLCVIAPNGVHDNWVTDEIEAHMPDRVAERLRSHIWRSTSAKYHATNFKRTLNHDGLATLVMSYNAVWTPKGRDAWKAFLKKRRCVYILDESHRVGSPGAKWSQRILGSKVAAPFKRVLSGTPTGGKPFKLYNQLRFLEPNVWHKYGIQDHAAFKAFFGVWRIEKTKDDRPYPVCVQYRNLDILNHELLRLGTRLTKEDAGLDLPPKLYSKRYVELSPKQKQMYADLKANSEVESATGILTAEMALTRLLRFQQITCGYLPGSDDDDELVPIPGPNPRLELCSEICEDLSHQAIIWARFQPDHELLANHKTFRGNCVMINGTVTGDRRAAAKKLFVGGDVQFMITSAQAMGMGHTLNMAKTCIYYSNSFSLIDRLQSEDRPHRIGQDEKVHYIDLVAPGTCDIRILEALRNGLEISQVIQGDRITEWI
jgi:SNF2 family DNA or RNA helicase